MIVVIGLPSFRPPAEGRAAAASGLAAGVARAAVAAGATVQLIGKVGDDPSGDALVLALARDGIGHVALLRDAVHPTPIDAATGDPDEFELGAAATTPDEGRSGRLRALAIAADSCHRRPRDCDRVGVGPGSGSSRPRHRRRPARGSGPAPIARFGDLELALRYQADFTVVIVAERLGPDARAAVFDAAAYAGAHVVELLDAGRDAGVPEADTAFERPESDPEGAFAGLIGRYAAAVDAGREPAAAFQRGLSGSRLERAWPMTGLSRTATRIERADGPAIVEPG